MITETLIIEVAEAPEEETITKIEDSGAAICIDLETTLVIIMVDDR